MLFANQREHFQHSGAESGEGAVTEEMENQGKVSELLIWGRPQRISNFWSSSWRELRPQYRVTSPKLQIQPATKPGWEPLTLGTQSSAFSTLSILILSPPVPIPPHAHPHVCTRAHVHVLTASWARCRSSGIHHPALVYFSGHLSRCSALQPASVFLFCTLNLHPCPGPLDLHSS